MMQCTHFQIMGWRQLSITFPNYYNGMFVVLKSHNLKTTSEILYHWISIDTNISQMSMFVKKYFTHKLTTD